MGATNLGLHLEGPFISKEKPGAHPVQFIQEHIQSFDTVLKCYGSLEHVAIVTLAPELEHASDTIAGLTERGIVVSMGHSNAHIADGERGLASGAKLLTHLFNAMSAFHHRDPGLVGLLAIDDVLHGAKTLHYGLIVDGFHTHPAALRIAHAAHPDGTGEPLCHTILMV